LSQPAAPERREGGAKYNSEVEIRSMVLIGLLLSGIGAAASQVTGAPWRDAPEYLPLFAPVGARAAAYRIVTSPGDLSTTLRQLETDDSLVRVPGSWQARAVLPLDAFGLAGSYDRSALARVYGARQPLVARGARMEHGRVVESWTLISPYPDAALQSLENGTLLIVLRLP
jgi:hypothetical protein